MTSLQSGSCASKSVAHALARRTLMHMSTSTRRCICVHNFRSCFLCSSPASRRILAVAVREQMHISNLVRTQAYCPSTSAHSHTHRRTRARHTMPAFLPRSRLELKSAFLEFFYAKSQAAKAAKIERRKSDTDPVSIYLLLQIVIFDCAFRSRSHI